MFEKVRGGINQENKNNAATHMCSRVEILYDIMPYHIFTMLLFSYFYKLLLNLWCSVQLMAV